MAAKTKSAARQNKSQKHKPKGVSVREFERVHWPYLPILAVIFTLLSFGIQSGALQAAVNQPMGSVLAYATSMSRSGLLAETNAERTAEGIATLKANSKLNAAAQAKAADMAQKNYWSHNTPDGDPPWIFVEAQGYAYKKLGENLAAGFSNESTTINGWMASPPHKANLLDPAFTEVGFGYANNANYTSAGGGPMTIVVAFYGKPAGASSPSPAPPPAASQKSSTPPAPSPPPAAQPKPEPEAEEQPEAEQQPVPAEVIKPEEQPVNTDNKNDGLALALRTSHAQVAFASVPLSSWATGMLSFLAFAAAGLWMSRHLLTLKRVVASGESFIFRHPLIDVGLVVIIALSYLLSRTAGFTL